MCVYIFFSIVHSPFNIQTWNKQNIFTFTQRNASYKIKNLNILIPVPNSRHMVQYFYLNMNFKSWSWKFIYSCADLIVVLFPFSVFLFVFGSTTKVRNAEICIVDIWTFFINYHEKIRTCRIQKAIYILFQW